MNISIKRKVAALTVAALTVVGGGAAIAAAQTGSRSEESQAIIADAAEELGIESTELTAALKQALIDSIEAKVAAGELSQAQANTLKAKIQSGDFPIIGGLHGPGFGHSGGFANLEAAASFLGLTSAELRAELADGKTLAEVATAEGKKVAGLVQALVAAAEERLDEDVSAGRLTQAQADTRKADLESRITDLVNRDLPGDLPGRGFGHPGGFAHLEAAASFLGLTSAELRAELADGKTLAEVATAEGKKVAGLVQALVAAAEERLDEDVSAGRLTQAQADARKADLEQRITDLVNGSFTGAPDPGNAPGGAAAA